MTEKETRQINAIKKLVHDHGDYSGLQNGGLELVYRLADETGVDRLELMRSWERPKTKPIGGTVRAPSPYPGVSFTTPTQSAARRTTVTVDIVDDPEVEDDEEEVIEDSEGSESEITDDDEDELPDDDEPIVFDDEE